MSEAKWVMFTPSNLAGLSTPNWRVKAKEGDIELGYIRFWPRWRKYTFHPLEQTFYEQDCLRDIAQFCEDRTREFWNSKRTQNEKAQGKGE